MELNLKHECTKDLSELSPLLHLAMSELKKSFMRVGGLEAHFGFECDTEEQAIEGIPNAGMFLKSQKLKNVLGSVLRAFAHHLTEEGKKPTICFSACEAWQSLPVDKMDTETLARLNENGVGEEEDKREVLMFNFENKTQLRMITYEIIRSGDDFVVSPEPIVDSITDKEPGQMVTKFQIWVDGKIYDDGSELGFEFGRDEE